MLKKFQKKNPFYMTARFEGLSKEAATKYAKKRTAEFLSNKKFPKKLYQK